jgi:hypothetical protein
MLSDIHVLRDRVFKLNIRRLRETSDDDEFRAILLRMLLVGEGLLNPRNQEDSTDQIKHSNHH